MYMAMVIEVSKSCSTMNDLACGSWRVHVYVHFFIPHGNTGRPTAAGERQRAKSAYLRHECSRAEEIYFKFLNWYLFNCSSAPCQPQEQSISVTTPAAIMLYPWEEVIYVHSLLMLRAPTSSKT